MTTSPTSAAAVEHRVGAVLCPFALDVSPIAAFLNCELADDPDYDGVEVQRFDDDVHGRGLLVFLSRRRDRRVDYYVEPGLRLDRRTYVIGGGTGHWLTTTFAAGRLDVTPDGVVVDVAFSDVDGRRVEVRVDDRDGRPRRRAAVLAPVGAGVEHPVSLLLVLMRRFDLVRTGSDPVVRIDGRAVATGRLPGQRLHRRRLVKYAADLAVATVMPTADGPTRLADAVAPDVDLAPDGRGIGALTAASDGVAARLAFAPAFPDVGGLRDGEVRRGRWRVDVDVHPAVTGGRWRVRRRGDRVAVVVDVTDRWRPPRRPVLMAAVTRLIPTFRRWPTTYRWRALVRLDAVPTTVSRWERTVEDRAESYRRLTGSG